MYCGLYALDKLWKCSVHSKLVGGGVSGARLKSAVRWSENSSEIIAWCCLT